MVQTQTPEAVDIAAGILLADTPRSDRESVIAEAHGRLERILGVSALWLSGRPGSAQGSEAHGTDLPRYRPVADLSAPERAAIAEAWAAVLAARAPGAHEFLRLRVDSLADVRRLRQLGTVDGLELAPSLDTVRGGANFAWRWPLRVGVAWSSTAEEWLAVLQDSSHHGHLFDAELFDLMHTYEIVLGDSSETTWMDLLVGGECGIRAGNESLDELVEVGYFESSPAIAVAFAGHPSLWWSTLLHEMSHDAPLDVAVELTRRDTGVEAVLAGPLRGLDITAPQRGPSAAAAGSRRARGSRR